MDVEKHFYGKEMVKNDDFCFFYAGLPIKTPKNSSFLSPLKNDPQQKWCVFKAEKLTAIVFIGYQYLANQQQKTCWKTSYSAF